MRLLLAVDINHDNPERVVNEAVFWAQRLDGTLDLAFVGIRAWSLGGAADPEVRALIEREATKVRNAEQQRLDELLEKIPKEHRGNATVLDGDPIEAIVDAAKGHYALLVGTHGRQGLSRFWLGSVSEQLVRRAQCPVIVMRLYTESS